MFLGGLPSNVTETDLRVFFGRYGKVMEVVIMYDQEKKKSRGKIFFAYLFIYFYFYLFFSFGCKMFYILFIQSFKQ